MGFFGAVGQAIASAFTTSAPKTPNTKPGGSDGVVSYGGFLASGERNPRLRGQNKWLAHSNAINTAIVATGVRYFTNLLAGTEWNAEPAEGRGRTGDRAADAVTQGLLKAQMPRPWQTVVRKSAMFRIHGFSLHEWMTKKRSDGLIVFADIQHRPQSTIWRWDKPDERGPWLGVEQQTQSGNRYVIPRSRLFYCFDDTLTDQPDGIGLMRHVIELVEKLTILQQLEGFGFETDLRGMPIGRAPLEELRAASGAVAGSKEERAFMDERTANLRGKLENIIKSPDKLQWLLLDSSAYHGADPNVISGIQKWAYELLRGDPGGLPDVDRAINRLQMEIARVLGIEFAMMGGQGGAYAMHEDKTSMFATNLATTLTEIAAFATNDLARVLTAFNGFDPETDTPTLRAEPVSTDAIEMVCRSLQSMAAAGLAGNDPARNVLRRRMNLPPEPEMSPEMMGVIPRVPTLAEDKGQVPPPPAPPDPAKGEKDVPVDDLGDDSNREAA